MKESVTVMSAGPRMQGSSARNLENMGVPSENPMQYAHRARWLLNARRSIDNVMPKKLFRDSAWDVMLELYIGLEGGYDIYVKQAIIASDECPATAMRIIARLEASGLLARRGDASDHRRVVVSLTDIGAAAMEKILKVMDTEPVRP